MSLKPLTYGTLPTEGEFREAFASTCDCEHPRDLPGWHLGADMLDYVVLYPEAP